MSLDIEELEGEARRLGKYEPVPSAKERETMEFMTREEVSELLKVSTKSVDKVIDKGDLVAYKFGGAVRVTRESLDNYLAGRVMGKGRKLKA